MSQNELQRVVAEILAMANHVKSYSPNAKERKLRDWAYRIEAAQAVAPGGGMCAKGQAFKDYVHQRLDAMGVPHSVPESEHDKAGCRIGGRLDFVEARIAPGGEPTPFNKRAFGLACTVAWTELVQALRADGHDVKDKSGPTVRKWMEGIVRDTFAAAPASEAKKRCAQCGFPMEAHSTLCNTNDAKMQRKPAASSYPAKFDKNGSETTDAADLIAASSAASEPLAAEFDRQADKAFAELMRPAEQEQAGELPQCWTGSPVTITWAEDGETTTREVYTADQMHAFYRKGYDAALLRRAARVEVTDAMVERLAKFIVSKESINCKTLYEAMFHQSNWRRAVSESREMLTAALEPQE